MAVLQNFIVGACALALLAQAAPVQVTVTDVVTQTHWETINCTSTVWLPINQSPTSTVIPTTYTSATASTVSVSVIASSPPMVSSSSTTSVYVAPVVATTSAIVSVASPVLITSTTAPVAAAVATPVTTSVAAAASSSSAPVASAGSFVQASSSGTCEGEGNACIGDVTHWDGGLGACGWNVDTASDLSIALPFGFMGTQSNGNPYCGRSVTLLNPVTGTTVQAKVGDKCMGCVDRAIDCTDALFNAITDGKGDGRVHGIEWWFT